MPLTRLFTIGDSISQGFMSGAAAQTELSYSSLLAKQLGIYNGPEYAYPAIWKQGGLPANIENVMRALNRRYGTNIRGIEWLTALSTINNVLDMAEDYYERGEGCETRPTPDRRRFYHNVAVRGFEVADAWEMNTQVALDNIRKENRSGGQDSLLFGTPNASFYRTAQKVLNPRLLPQYMNSSPLDWLAYHVNRGGVENLCLWLGANNALGTVVRLEIRQTPGMGNIEGLTHDQRIANRWNLYHPVDFEVDYRNLLAKVDAIMRQNPQEVDWKVFIGNVPYVSIAPLLKGVGPTTKINTPLGNDVYYKYYTYFPFSEEFAHRNDLHLTMNQVLHIDNCIREYNAIIARLASKYNAEGSSRYHVIDFAKILHDMAWKRNGGEPTYPFPAFFDFVYPRIDTKYYHVSVNGTMKQGGIFSLDGVHPTAIGHGLIAHEFIGEMNKAGRRIPVFTNNDWQAIFDSDTLYSAPITLMGELYEHEKLAEFVLNAVKFFKD